jgi:hypothetical protein
MTASFVIQSGDTVAVTFADAPPSVQVRVDQPAPFGVVMVQGPQGPPGQAAGELNFAILSNSSQNGVTVTFALPTPTSNAASVQVLRNGLAEVRGIGFTATTTSITFTSAPLPTDVLVVGYSQQQ